MLTQPSNRTPVIYVHLRRRPSCAGEELIAGLRSEGGLYEHAYRHSMAQKTLLTGSERRRRWSDEDRERILTAAFAPGAIVSDVARQFEVSTSLIYKWREQASVVRARRAFAPAVLAAEASLASAL